MTDAEIELKGAAMVASAALRVFLEKLNAFAEERTAQAEQTDEEDIVILIVAPGDLVPEPTDGVPANDWTESQLAQAWTPDSDER